MNTKGNLTGYTSEDVDVLIQFVNRRGYPQIHHRITLLESSQAGDRADASVMSHLENLKAEVWALSDRDEAHKTHVFNAIRAYIAYKD